MQWERWILVRYLNQCMTDNNIHQISFIKGFKGKVCKVQIKWSKKTCRFFSTIKTLTNVKCYVKNNIKIRREIGRKWIFLAPLMNICHLCRTKHIIRSFHKQEQDSTNSVLLKRIIYHIFQNMRSITPN